TGRFSASNAAIAAVNSMRLLVVAGSPPKSSFSWPAQERMAPQPPGPGLPEQAPSVQIETSPLIAATQVREGRRVSGESTICRNIRAGPWDAPGHSPEHSTNRRGVSGRTEARPPVPEPEALR